MTADFPRLPYHQNLIQEKYFAKKLSLFSPREAVAWIFPNDSLIRENRASISAKGFTFLPGIPFEPPRAITRKSTFNAFHPFLDAASELRHRHDPLPTPRGSHRKAD